MSRVQKTVVKKRKDGAMILTVCDNTPPKPLIDPKSLKETEYMFLNLPVLTSEEHRVWGLKRFPKRKTKRVLKKWWKKYKVLVPDEGADIYSHMVLCHPNSLWRFADMEFIPYQEN